jgi:glycosyltransferase involved in cell wall biosynthesis
VPETMISAVVITFNEEKNIRRCLDSLIQVTDDIVVLDSQSTDKTVSICEEYKQVRCIQVNWEGYGPTKNLARQYAKYPWILSLDADECLDAEAILGIKKCQLEQKTVYQFARKNHYQNIWIKHGGWYPDYKSRLYPKKVSWSNSKVHEDVEMPQDYSLQLLQGNILHYTIDHMNGYRATLHKYAKLRAEQSILNGKRVTAVQALGSGLARFLKTYFMRKGFLDGRLGLKLSMYSIYARWYWWVYYKELRKQSP